MSKTFKTYLQIKRNKHSKTVDGWSIVVRVGCDGTEVRVSIQPHAKIYELHSKVQAICGVGGRLWPVLTVAGCGEAKPLRFGSTLQEFGWNERMVSRLTARLIWMH
jgi:hypothetical protein